MRLSRLKYWGVGLSLFLLASPVQALGVSEVVKELNSNYPPLLEARLKLSQVKGKLLEKQGAFDTEIKTKFQSTPFDYYQNIQLDTQIVQPTSWWGATFFTGYRLGQGKFADYDGKKETLNLGEIRTGLNLPLLKNRDIDSRRAEIASLQLKLQSTELDIFQKQLKYTSKALKSYWKWVSARQKRAVAEGLLQLSQTRIEQLQVQINLGKKAPISALENKRALLKRQNKLLDIQRKEQTAALNLGLFLKNNRALNETDTAVFPQQNVCQLPPSNPLIKEAVKQRPEILIFYLHQAQNQLGIRLAQNQNLPDVGLFLVFSQDMGSGSKTKAPFEAKTGLNLKWPLQMRKAQGQLIQLNAEKEQLKVALGFSKAKVVTEINQALVGLKMACTQFNFATQEVDLAIKLAQAEKERFELGATTLFIVNKREQAAADASMRRLNALQLYFQAESDLFLARGLLPLPKTNS